MLTLRLSGLFAALAALTACHNDGRSLERFNREMCVANIPVFPPDQLPAQPYRVVAPVDSYWGLSASSRFQRMKAHACALGADAIIDSADRYVQTSSTTTTVQYDAAGHPIAIQAMAASPARRSGPVAIKFLVPVTAQVATAAPPVVTIVTPPPSVTIVEGAPPPAR